MSGSYTTGYKHLSFHDAVPAMLEGGDSPSAYLERCLAVIEKREPEVRAWQSMRIDGAREDAAASSARYAAGKPLSLIDGMPVGLKDLIQTRDLPTSLGIEGNEQATTGQDSACVQALRDAGAIILGKVTTTELGGGWPSKSKNPFDPARTPGGSSSGSGAAIGAGMIPVAIGTQVAGSIIRPSAFCANFAIKPTYGALHRGERQALSQACLGVHAGSLTDMWRTAMAIGSRTGGDPGHPGLFGGDDLSAPVRPVRLGVVESDGWALADPRARQALEAILDLLAGHGVTFLRRADSPEMEALETAIAGGNRMAGFLVTYENRWLLENLYQTMPEKLSSMTKRMYDAGQKIELSEYRKALADREVARMRMAALASQCDALITLSCLGPAPRIDSGGGTGDPAFNTFASALGGPAVTLPLIEIDGMPVGVQLVGQWHSDERICGIARWIQEAVLPVRGS
ncbi:MAG: amidase [Rhizorhabdus sp.]